MGGEKSSSAWGDSYLGAIAEAERRIEDDRIAIDLARKLRNLSCDRRAYIRKRTQELLGCND